MTNTPTPWKVYDPEKNYGKGYIEIVREDEGQHKTICMILDHENECENAAFIVNAVNNHEALIEAIEELLATPNSPEAQSMALKAIQAAKGDA